MEKISYSQLASYLFCPKMYEFSYILKMPVLPNKYASFGSTLHNTLQKFYEKIQNHKNSPSLFLDHAPDVSLESLLQIYHSCWVSKGFSSNEEEILEQDRGEKILREFYAKHGTHFGNPLILEKGFQLKIGDVIVTGRFDRIDECDAVLNGDQKKKLVEIIDYKTGKIRTQESVQNDLQLAMYQLAAEQNFHVQVKKVSLYFLQENEKIEVQKTPEQLEDAQKTVLEVAEKIQKKEFTATPSKDKCQNCDYRKKCIYAV